MRRDVTNALVRRLRDLRFELADRYRTLLASRFVALASVAAGVLDVAWTTGATARRLRRARPGSRAPQVAVASAALGAGGQLSVVVRVGGGVATPELALRRGEELQRLDTLADARDGVVRMVATLPAAAVGTRWTVAFADGDSVIDLDVAHAAAGLPAPLRADGEGRLTVELGEQDVAGVVHDLTIGVRTLLITWPAADGTALRLTAADRTPDVRVTGTVAGGSATASVDLAALPASSWTATVAGPDGDRPLTLPLVDYPRLARFSTTHRVTVPAANGARRVEVGYGDGNRLTVRVAAGEAAP